MDSMGLGTLMQLYVSARTHGCSLELINIGKRIQDLLELTNIWSVFAPGGRAWDQVLTALPGGEQELLQGSFASLRMTAHNRQRQRRKQQQRKTQIPCGNDNQESEDDGSRKV